MTEAASATLVGKIRIDGKVYTLAALDEVSEVEDGDGETAGAAQVLNPDAEFSVLVALENLGNPDAVTTAQIREQLPPDAEMNLNRTLPAALCALGYRRAWSDKNNMGTFVVNRRSATIYAKADLPMDARLRAVAELIWSSEIERWAQVPGNAD